LVPVRLEGRPQQLSPVPWMWIIAGPNGAGKSTLTRYGVIRQTSGLNLVELNADVRASQILASQPDAPDAALRAARDTDAAVIDCIEQGKDFLIETVLSTDKYLDDVQRAIELGFKIGIIYVALATPEDAVRRVALRAAQQGHDVPADRVRARFRRSAAMLGRFVPLCHRVYVFDNSAPATEGDPALIAYKDDSGVLVLQERGRIPLIDEVLSPFCGDTTG
jgi:predicted ABC-type ATPase